MVPTNGQRIASRSTCVERNVMTVSEYEERFRFSAPSLHETFVAMQGTRARRRRRPRFWAAVASKPVDRGGSRRVARIRPVLGAAATAAAGAPEAV